MFAPGTSTQPVEPFGELCHWKVRPPPALAPESVSVIAVAELPDEGEAPAVPAEGVAEHAAAPLPETATVTADERPPPVIVTLPEYEVTAVGVKRTNTATLVTLFPV